MSATRYPCRGAGCPACEVFIPRQRKIQVELEIGGERPGAYGMVDARVQDNLNLLVLEWPAPLPPLTARSVDGVVFLDPIFDLTARPGPSRI